MLKEYTNDTLLQYLQTMVPVIHRARGVTAFVLNHNYKEIYDKVSPYMDIRNELIQKYGELQEDGSYNIEDPEKLEEANEKLASYAELKLTVDIVKLPEDRMGDSNLTAGQLTSLSWMIVPSTGNDIRMALGLPIEEELKDEEDPEEYDVKNPPADDRF